MSQEELAFASNVDRTFVSGIERGVSNPTLQTLTLLCDAMNAALPEIFQDVESYPPGMFGKRRKNAAKPQMPTVKRRLR
jgi:transcriptional regulator with XRE-family HTH domain